jgi:hypothetical protein
MSLIKAYSETLTNIGVKYVQDPNVFKAGNIFPRVPVALQSSTYFTYPIEYWMKDEAAERKPGTQSEGGTHARGTATYSCKNIAWHEDLPMEQLENDPAPVNSEAAAVQLVNQKLLIKDEVEWCSNYFVTGAWDNEATPTALWDTATGVPITDTDLAKRSIQRATGFRPNTMVVSRTVHDKLKSNAQILEKLKYTTNANITEDILARILEVNRYIVLDAVYDTAAYGATAAQSFIGADNALLLYTPPAPSINTPSAGYNFVWGGYGVQGYGVRRLTLEEEMAIRVEGHNYRDMNQVSSALGFMFLAPVTSDA